MFRMSCQVGLRVTLIIMQIKPFKYFSHSSMTNVSPFLRLTSCLTRYFSLLFRHKRRNVTKIRLLSCQSENYFISNFHYFLILQSKTITRTPTFHIFLLVRKLKSYRYSDFSLFLLFWNEFKMYRFFKISLFKHVGSKKLQVFRISLFSTPQAQERFPFLVFTTSTACE